MISAVAVLLVMLASDDPAPPAAYAPCATAPKGMTCIAGGPAVVGSDDGPKNERPKRSVEISTFYMDLHEVTNAEYDACVAAGVCAKLPIPDINKGIMKSFDGADQPAMPLDYDRAAKFCAWAGKRLPTEWEWEKAARGDAGDIHPWGNDPATCDKAQFRECAPKGCKPYPGTSGNLWDCPEHATKPVGSYPPGHYGLLDMAGNGYEWTSTWAGEDPTGKCDGCTGRDPQGPCGGTDPCQKGGAKKILRGGSWYWPKEQMRGSFRRPEVPSTFTHRLSARCATSSPLLWGYPTKIATEKRTPPELKDPPAEQKKIAHDIVEDTLDKQECGEKGRSFIDCRDPTSYIKTNEPRQFVWKPYITNLGGGYTGVGIDQNYSFIALQKAEWAWLFDYDPTVVRLHWIIRAMVLASDTRQAFAEQFSEAKKADALALLDTTYAGNAERPAYREVYAISRKPLYTYYQRELLGEKEDPTFGWLASDEAYAYVRKMYQQDRIVILKGDMLAKNGMQSIGKAARALNVPIRVYYPSNAPECWPHTAQYKRNVLALPFDDESVVLQTLSGIRPGFGETKKGHWHYNVQAGLLQQQYMREKQVGSAKQLVTIRNKTDDPDLTVSGLVRATQ
jgi:sulfatase modifying factor 1